MPWRPQFPWGPKTNRQGNDSFLGGPTPHWRKHIFLAGLSKPPRNMGVSLAVSNHLQGNECYSQPPREILISLAIFLNRQVNYHFLEGYWISLEVGTQENAYKYFGDFDWKSNNILKVSKNHKIWLEIIIWLYYLTINFSNHINNAKCNFV